MAPQLVCPLYGRFASLKYFNPDIFAVIVEGRGRGKGVRVTEKYSIVQQENPTVELLKNQMRVLLRVLLDDDCLQIEDVFTALQACPPDQAKKGSLVQDLADEIVTLTSRVLDRDR